MTKIEFRNIVKRGFFSIKWLKKDGTVGHIKRGVIGEMGRRFTQSGQVNEHPNYCLVFCVSNTGKHGWANVNPKVPHRRWSQEFEKDIGTGKKYPTKIFNGYEKWVSHLYKGVDSNSLFF